MKVIVIAHPNSRHPRIETDLTGILHIHVSAPPLEGKANIAVIDSLAAHFHISKNNIIQLSGRKSKQKSYEITGEGI